MAADVGPMQHTPAHRTWRAVALTGLVAVALAAPAGARAGGAEWTAVEGGPCDDTVSVPVTGRYKELYTCVDDRWVVMDAVGTQGPQGVSGRDGTQGPQGVSGRDGTDGPTGAQGDQGPQGAQGEHGAQGPRGDQGDPGPQGPQGEQGPQGPAGPGLTMYTGSFAGPTTWEPGGTAPVLPAALEPVAGTWAATFHVVVAAGTGPLDAVCTLELAGAPAPTALEVRASVPAGGRTTLSGTGWLLTSGTEIVNVSCHDGGGTTAGTVESGTLNLVPVEAVLGPPAG